MVGLIDNISKIKKSNHEDCYEIWRERYLNSHYVVVAGGRDFDDYDYLSCKLDELFFYRLNLPELQSKLSQEWQRARIHLHCVMPMSAN